MQWTPTNLLLATLSICLGSVLQAVTGLGAGLVVVPLLALISYNLIPGPMIFASLSLSLIMAIRGREDIDSQDIKKLFFGLFVGTALAAVFIARLKFSQLGIVFGVFILAAVALSLLAGNIKVSGKQTVIAGVLSGFMGTSAGIGAPVLALIYQNRSGPAIRATLALLYSGASIVMLGSLYLAGRFGPGEVQSGFYLMPGFVLGYFVSPKLVQWIDRGYARPAVLILSTLSAVILIAKSLRF